MEIEQKGVKWVDASGMAVRVHAEKAVSAEEEQEWQVLMESVGRKSGRLERNLPGRGRKPRRKCGKTAQPGARTGRKTWRKRGKMPRLRGENRPENVEKTLKSAASQGRAGGRR